MWILTLCFALTAQRYIPAAIQPALKAGHDEHLAEMRDLSVLFVKCTGLDITSDEFGNCADVCFHSNCRDILPLTQFTGDRLWAALDVACSADLLLMPGLNQQILG